MGYEEEIFSRAEKQFVSESKILDWLSSFERPERGATDYTRDAVTVRNELISSIATKEKVEKIDVTDWKNIDILRNLLNEEESKVGRSKETETVLKSQIRIVEKLEEEEVARQEALRVEEESRKFMLEEWKTAETVSEEREIRRELKAELPFTLRSARGWQSRRGKEAFRFIFS